MLIKRFFSLFMVCACLVSSTFYANAASRHYKPAEELIDADAWVLSCQIHPIVYFIYKDRKKTKGCSSEDDAYDFIYAFNQFLAIDYYELDELDRQIMIIIITGATNEKMQYDLDIDKDTLAKRIQKLRRTITIAYDETGISRVHR